jgi:hypothetical protein
MRANLGSADAGDLSAAGALVDRALAFYRAQEVKR